LARKFLRGAMITWTYRSWRSVGVAAVLGLAACGGEGGEAGRTGEGGEAGESGEGAAPAPANPTTASTEGAGEAGEAGAASAYAGLSGDQLTALRLQHLKGFLMAADRVAGTRQSAEAGILVEQGLLEVYDPAPDQFGGVDIAIVRAAGASDADISARIQAAEAALDGARNSLEFDHAVLAARMVDIATGLYQGVVQEDFVDPVEYQHSMGAALAARDALISGESELKRRDARAYRDARVELDRLIALWETPQAGETAAPYAQVLAQGSRVRLALSPYL
jgi:hypothetical protein